MKDKQINLCFTEILISHGALTKKKKMTRDRAGPWTTTTKSCSETAKLQCRQMQSSKHFCFVLFCLGFFFFGPITLLLKNLKSISLTGTHIPCNWLILAKNPSELSLWRWVQSFCKCLSKCWEWVSHFPNRGNLLLCWASAVPPSAEPISQEKLSQMCQGCKQTAVSTRHLLIPLWNVLLSHNREHPREILSPEAKDSHLNFSTEFMQS